MIITFIFIVATSFFAIYVPSAITNHLKDNSNYLKINFKTAWDQTIIKEEKERFLEWLNEVPLPAKPKAIFPQSTKLTIKTSNNYDQPFGDILKYLRHRIAEHHYRQNKSYSPKTYIDQYGYRRFKDSDILVHRYVAQKIIKRHYRRGEVVHHIDGNKLNNNQFNLYVCSSWEHNRIHRNNLARYGRWHVARI